MKRPSPQVITVACGIMGLAAICAAGFLLGLVFAWAYLWVGAACVGVSLLLLGEMFRE